jgi:hypothetical protein
MRETFKKLHTAIWDGKTESPYWIYNLDLGFDEITCKLKMKFVFSTTVYETPTLILMDIIH